MILADFYLDKIMTLEIVKVRNIKEQTVISEDRDSEITEIVVDKIEYCIKERNSTEFIACFSTYKEAMEEVESIQKNMKNSLGNN